MNFFQNLTVEFLSRFLNAFKNHPVVIERISLIFANSLTSFILLVILFSIWMLKDKFPKIFSFKNFIYLVFIGYFFIRTYSTFSTKHFLNTYYSPFSVICLIFDIYLTIFCIESLGKFCLQFYNQRLEAEYKSLDSKNGEAILLGLSLVVLCSSAFTIFFSPLLKYSKISLLGFTWISFLFLKHLKDRKLNLDVNRLNSTIQSNAKRYFPWIYILLPFIPYLFSPAPPDADIISIADQIGFTLQGQNLPKVLPAFGGEEWFIRYPNGFSSVNVFLSFLLNIGTAETLYLTWILSWILLFYALSTWGKVLGISPWILAILFVNPVTTGYHGLHGGQTQEILAYALGCLSIYVLSQSYQNRRLQLSIFGFLATVLIHPLVGVIFVPCFLWLLIHSYISSPIKLESKLLKKYIPTFVAVLFVAIYLGYLILGLNQFPSQPEILLKSLTVIIFMQNIWLYLNADSLGMWWIFPISFTWIYFSKDKIISKNILLSLFLWFVGGVLADGLFGHTLWGARFYGSFSTVGVWIICCGFFLTQLRSQVLKLMNSFEVKSNVNFFFVRSVVLLLPLCAWYYHLKSPGFMLRSEAVFISFSDTILARRFERQPNHEVKRDSIVIVNTRVPDDFESDFGMGSMLRSELKLPVIFGRLGSHQLKYSIEDQSKREKIRECRADKNIPLENFLDCLRKIPGLSYVFFPSRRKTEEFARDSNLNPVDSELFARIYKL